MVVRCKGTCVFVGEPTKVQTKGMPDRVKKSFGFMMETPGRMPEVVKVVSYNGFAPKMGEKAEFDARINASVFNGKAYLNVEVI